MSDLLPCPFCGVALVNYGIIGVAGSHPTMVPPAEWCCLSDFQVMDEDVAAWNRRPTAAPEAADELYSLAVAARDAGRASNAEENTYEQWRDAIADFYSAMGRTRPADIIALYESARRSHLQQ